MAYLSTYSINSVCFIVYLFMLFILFSQVLEKFVAEFFDQNPISQMGVIETRKGRAEKVAELSGKLAVQPTKSGLEGGRVGGWVGGGGGGNG